LVATGCGGGAAVDSGQPSCRPEGTTLHLTARSTRFSVDCLAAPADAAFTINFDNQDPGIAHVFVIHDQDPRQDPSARQLFRGEQVTGPDMKTYEVGPLAAGTYHFRCDFHPDQMFGAMVIEGE
jgi:plastocyanin